MAKISAIQELFKKVLKARVTKSTSTDTGAEWQNSRSLERYRVDRAVMILLKMSSEKNVRNTMLKSSFARRSPIISTD